MKKREIRAVGIDTSFVYQSFLRDSEEKKRLGIPVLEDSLVQEILLWLNKDFQLRSVEWELPYILCNAIAFIPNRRIETCLE